jgi:light-regulated signal transduction histidine kinase (bacteriophytochrome)
LFKVGGTTFFVGCGLTHTHITVHAITDGQFVTWHEIVFHAMQIAGVWAFIYAALRLIDVRIMPRRTPEEEQADELRERVSALSRSNADLEQFAHVVSHDLQEPLRTVAGFASLLRSRYDGRLDDDGDEFLRHMTDGCARMGSMLEGVLTYSKVAGAGLERAPVDMEEVVREVEQSLGAARGDHGGSVTWDSLPTVEGDPVQLRQLMQNLIANGLKFNRSEHPHVHVSAEDTGAGWRFAVRDNGIGVDPAQAHRIFGMFQRLDTREAFEGTGLGLALCSRIAARHGGELWVEPAEGGGSVFRFALVKRLPAGANGSAPSAARTPAG